MKGNLHTHSLWSDGDDFPEMVVDWYQQHGYDFVALSDHNQLAEGERWVRIGAPWDDAEVALAAYVRRFGESWVQRRTLDDTLYVRLRTFEEYRSLLEVPGRFLVIQSEEITDAFQQKPVHLNATNVRELVPPQGGTSVRDVIQRNVDAVLAQRETTGQAMFPHLNHPNFGWAVTVEDIIPLRGERFFEVYNGHPAVHNEGDGDRPGTERMWDIVLTERLRHGDDLMFGLAVDDAHAYRVSHATQANPGRGWVMVRAATLSADAVIRAMEAGDFYATNGVVLDDVVRTAEFLRVHVRPERGVEYRIEFVGTRHGVPSPRPLDAAGDGDAVRRRYDARFGEVLQSTAGPSATYRFRGDELYVRAKVTSSKPKANPYRAGEMEMAWTQPVAPGGSR